MKMNAPGFSAITEQFSGFAVLFPALLLLWLFFSHSDCLHFLVYLISITSFCSPFIYFYCPLVKSTTNKISNLISIQTEITTIFSQIFGYFFVSVTERLHYAPSEYRKPLYMPKKKPKKLKISS